MQFFCVTGRRHLNVCQIHGLVFRDAITFTLSGLSLQMGDCISSLLSPGAEWIQRPIVVLKATGRERGTLGNASQRIICLNVWIIFDSGRFMILP